VAADAYDVGAELDRQVATLVDKGYPAIAGVTPQELTDLVAPLRSAVLDLPAERPVRGRVPFALVVDTALVPAVEAMPMTRLNGRPGCVSRDTQDIDTFTPIEGVPVPSGDVHLVLDVDRGPDTRNVTPDDALVSIVERGRSPLTVDEGIAVITHFPEMLEKNHCFSLLASRCGDRRVPALWISDRRPKLGWCWAGNPHTWLGSASCAGRVGLPGSVG